MTMHAPIVRVVCHVCGYKWAVRGGKFTNHHRMLRGTSVRCAGSQRAPETDDVAEAFAHGPVKVEGE